MAGAPEIQLLGELGVVRGGRPVALPASRKTRALVGYLAISGRAHTREELCDMLWQGPDDPRAALRWSLTKLRGVLGANGIVADRERIALGRIETDLASVRAALAGGVGTVSTETLRSVASRFRGELLEGLTLPDCYRYHEWSTAQRDAARSLRVSVLAALVERCASDPEEALRWARQHASIDPLSEAAHVALIRLLGELGRKRDALAQYETCRRILEQELGARPTPALLEAKMRLTSSATSSASSTDDDIARQPSGSPGPVTKPAALAASGTPFVGRAAELEIVDRSANDAAKGKQERVLIFFGEPGMGKSRLLDELGKRVLARGGLVLSGRAFEAEMVRPYGPWIDAFRSLTGRVPETLRQELGALLPELGTPNATANDRAGLFDAVVRLLAHFAAKEGPVAVVLDDLHWFDETTAALLHYVVRELRGARIVVACSARAGELSDNPAALRLVRALAKDGRSTRVDVGPLDPESVATLARGLAPGVDTDRVVEGSAGNPLFALELTRAFGHGDGSGWDSIGSLISERLARLDEPARELLGWAAALGTRFDLATLERVAGASPLDLGTRIAELERHGIVRASADGAGYDFVHDLVRAGAYRQFSEPRRRGVHRQIARALDAIDDPDGTRAGDIAHHAALGGDAELAARAAIAAGQRCLRMLAGAEAARVAEAGLQQLPSLSRARRIATEIALLRVLFYSGARALGAERLQALLTRAVVEAQDAGMHADATQGLQVLSTLQYDGGDLHGAHETSLRAAGAGRGADPLTLAGQLGNTARCLAMLERDMPQAQAMYGEARAIAERTGARVVAIEWAGALLRAFDGDSDAAVGLYTQALALARSAEDRWTEYECLRDLVQLELEAESPSGSDHSAELIASAAKMGEGSERIVAEALHALLCLRRNAPNADRAVEEAIIMLRDADAKGMLAYTLAFAAELDIGRGRVDAGERRAAEALRAAEAVNRRSLVAIARVLLARAAIARGDRDTARDHLGATHEDLAAPLGLSARARAAIASVSETLNLA